DGTVTPPSSNYSQLPLNGDVYARQQYAKFLYLMMMMLSDQTNAWTNDTLGVVTLQELTARRIAQWAVNVVDFRDADSIMTPFEYDVNPFNGWSVDGVVSNPDSDGLNVERRVVWGCEFPDLLLTETMAMHDRRVKDTPNDSGANNDRGDSKGTM